MDSNRYAYGRHCYETVSIRMIKANENSKVKAQV